MPRTSRVACVCPPVFRSRRSVTAIYTLLGSSLVLPTPQAHRPVVAPPSVPSSYCTTSVAETGLGLRVMLGFPVFRKFSLPLTLLFWFPLRVLIFSFVILWHTAKVFLLLPPHLFDLFLYLRFGWLVDVFISYGWLVCGWSQTRGTWGDWF